MGKLNRLKNIFDKLCDAYKEGSDWHPINTFFFDVVINKYMINIGYHTFVKFLESYETKGKIEIDKIYEKFRFIGEDGKRWLI